MGNMPLEADVDPTMSPRRILLYCVLSAQGGIETHILALSAALAAAGHLVTVGAKSAESLALYRERFNRLGVAFVVAPEPPKALRTGRLRSLGDLWRTATLFWLLWPGRFDLVALHAGGTAGRLLRQLVGPQGRLTYHEHVAGVPQLLQRPAYRALLAHCDFVTANSIEDAVMLRRAARQTHHLMALTVPPPTPVKSCTRERGAMFRVGFVGNLEAAEKGALRLWDLWRATPPLDCELHFFGRGDVPGTVGTKPPANVILHGPFPREDVGSIFAKIDLLVHPAEQESLGLVLIEAMAYGVPFLCTRVGGMVALTEGNPDAGFTQADNASLCSSIASMKQSVERGEIQPQRLRDRYESNFGPTSLGQRWVSLYASEY